MAKKFYLIFGCIVATLVVVVLLLRIQVNPAGKIEEEFIGTITEIDTGCWVDGTCSMTIDGKKVIFGRGWSKSEWGKLIDFGPDTLSSYNGKDAEVYAKRLDSYYTLEGSKDYYIKFLPYGKWNMIPRNSFPFFKTRRIVIKAVPSPEAGLFTQGAIDSEIGLERWKYIATKDGEENEIGDLYSKRKDAITETHTEIFNSLIQEERLRLDRNQAREFAKMVLNLTFNSVYDRGFIQYVTDEGNAFKATARLRQTIGMVPYHNEADLMFSFSKDGTLIQFQRGEWMEVKGH